MYVDEAKCCFGPKLGMNLVWAVLFRLAVVLSVAPDPREREITWSVVGFPPLEPQNHRTVMVGRDL